MDVFVVTAWNANTEEDYVAVFANAKLARAALAKVTGLAGLEHQEIYAGIERRRIIGYGS